jgi:hypothetical protein
VIPHLPHAQQQPRLLHLPQLPRAIYVCLVRVLRVVAVVVLLQVIMSTKVDANQSSIVAALRAAGATVTVLAGVGAGCPDLLAGFQDHNYLFEVKNLEGRGDRLTDAQREWIRRWAGQVAVVYNEQDALAVLYGSYE